MIVLGALSAGFIPIFSSLIKNKASDRKNGQKENQEAWQLASNVANSLLISLIALSLIGIIFAPQLVKIIAPGFGVSEQQSTVALTRIMFLSPIFLGMSGILGGILQSFKKFFVYSLAPIFYNIGIIIGALYFVDIFGITGLAWGVVLGAALHFLIQLPAVYNLGFKYSFVLNWKNEKLRKIGKMMVPRTMSLAISQINLVVITITPFTALEPYKAAAAELFKTLTEAMSLGSKLEIADSYPPPPVTWLDVVTSLLL